MSSPDYSQAVKDIIDGLGDSPTPDQIYHAVRNYSVDNVVAAAASVAKAGGGGGGGSQTLAEVLVAGNDADQNDITNARDVHADNVFLGDGGYVRGGSASDPSDSKTAFSQGAGGGGGDIDFFGGAGTSGNSGGSLNLYAGSGDDGAGSGASLSLQGGGPGFQGVGDFIGNLIIRFGTIILGLNSEPSDGDIFTGRCALWFDKTNGAAKFMIKAKQANGTVVTGEIPLA